jgi:polar amino acid transport system substrate-binding protein
MKRYSLFLLITLLAISLVSISCQAQVIKVAINATYPPFNYIDKQTGQIIGFDINLMDLIAEKEGFKVEYVKVDLDPLLQGMAQGKYDAAISALSITPERQKEMLFSEPYFVSGQVVMVFIENDTIIGKDSLGGKVVGVETGSTGAAAVNQMSGVIAKHYTDMSTAFNDLMNDKIDAVVSDDTIASLYLRNYPQSLKMVGAPFSQEEYAIAVAKNKPELLEKINAGLKAVKSQGLLEELNQKWLTQ